MARAKTATLLPLDQWAILLGLDPFNFNQIGVGFPNESPLAFDTGCQHTFYQYEWQFDYLSREEIAKTINRAEHMIADVLGYFPAPKYIVEENELTPRINTPYAYGGMAWSFGWYFPYSPPRDGSVQLKWTRVLGGGTLARTNIGDTANLTLSDSDGDGIDDLFTCSIATTVTDVNEIGVYFRAVDRVPANVPVAEEWRLRPVNVTLSGGTATITGHVSLLVKPNLTTIVDPEPLDVTDTTIYVSELNVQRVYTDTADQGVALWEQVDDCNSETDSPCDMLTEPVCIGNRNGKRGQVFIRFTEDGCCTAWRPPDQVTVNYLAGLPLENGQMQTDMAQIVACLAAGLLPTQKCGCDRADRIISYWRTDVTQPPSDVASARMLTPHELTSPFGFTRGALYAWNRLREKIDFVGVSI